MVKSITRVVSVNAKCLIRFPGKTSFIIDSHVYDGAQPNIEINQSTPVVKGITSEHFTGLRKAVTKKVAINKKKYEVETIKNDSNHKFKFKLKFDSTVPSGTYKIQFFVVPLDEDGYPFKQFNIYGSNVFFDINYNQEKSAFDYQRNVKLIQKYIRIWRKSSFEANPVDYVDKLFHNPKALGIPEDFEKLFKAVTKVYTGLSPEAKAFTDQKTGQIQSVEQHYKAVESYYNYCIANFHTVRQKILHDLKVADRFSVSIEGNKVTVQKKAFNDAHFGPLLISQVEEDFVNYINDMLTRMYIILAQAGRKAYHGTVPQAGISGKGLGFGQQTQ